jgi:hypothetical protein
MSEEPQALHHVDELRLAAILAADVAGYSHLMGKDEAQTSRDLKGHAGVVLSIIASDTIEIARKESRNTPIRSEWRLWHGLRSFPRRPLQGRYPPS